jgi:hypothetical protein
MEAVMNRKHWLFVVTAALTLASCGGSAITTRGSMGNKSGGSHVTAAAASPGLPVVIKSWPYPSDPNGATAVAAMQGLPRYLPIRWIVAPPGPTTGYYVVLAFGERPVGSKDYCEVPTLAPRPASTPTAIYATFCYNDILLSEAQVNAGPVTGPDDPEAREIMAALIQTLMPSNTSFNRSGAD